MTPEQAGKILGVLNDIAGDMEADAAAFDGKPFNGRTGAEYFGNQGAAIQALAKTLALVIVELPQLARAEGTK